MQYLTSNDPPPDIKDWEFVCETPNGGKEYYKKDPPTIAVIYSSVVKVFTKIQRLPIARKPFPSDFSVCTYYRRLN